MADKYAWITDEMFDEKLRELAQQYDLLTIPGVYELVKEDMNNEVLQALEQDRENDSHTVNTLNIED